MPKSESPRIEALEALLADCQKHESFLTKLEERRATTPEGTYQKLREEYQTRLTDLQVRASAEAEGVSAGIEQDEAAVADIEERLAAAHEERIEGELRTAVGEYEPKDWTKKQAVLNATIAQLEKERDARSSVFERTRHLVEAAKLGGIPSAAASGSQEPSSGSSSGPSSGPSRSAASMAGAPSFDELAFLNSVVGRASGPIAPPPAPRTSRPVPVPMPVPVPVQVPVETEAPSAPAPTSRPFLEPLTDPILEPRSASSGPSADDGPPGPLGRPTPRTSQAVKTLKCQECGTLNYPTEWYCERCGGELAAL